MAHNVCGSAEGDCFYNSDRDLSDSFMSDMDMSSEMQGSMADAILFDRLAYNTLPIHTHTHTYHSKINYMIKLVCSLI